MGLGIMSDSDFMTELKRSESVDTPSLPKRVEILDKEKSVERSRGEGNNEVPDSLRRIIGETGVVEGRQAALQLAEQFGISPSSVSAYTNGSTGTKTYDKQPNLDFLNKARLRVVKKARRVMMKSMDSITDDKLELCDAVENATVARSMSAIIKDMEPQSPRDGGDGKSGPQYVFFSPTILQENHYETVQAKE